MVTGFRPLRSTVRVWPKRCTIGVPMKTVIIFMLGGALLGIAVASLVVPPALAWYSSPGGLPQGAQIQAIVQISEVISYSTSRLIRGQAIGALIGAGVGLVTGIVIDVRSRRPKVSSETPPPGPPGRPTPA